MLYRSIVPLKCLAVGLVPLVSIVCIEYKQTMYMFIRNKRLNADKAICITSMIYLVEVFNVNLSNIIRLCYLFVRKTMLIKNRNRNKIAWAMRNNKR